MKYMHDNSQKRLFGSAQKPSSSQGCGDKSICMQAHPSHKEQVQKAEIFWALKVASSGIHTEHVMALLLCFKLCFLDLCLKK
ncbi:hypothetical protein DPMN_061702 [Dreissena polymorpha]|uniref:Uncharacterized protein n=1 Tax=Dreissena polymorpha TaxID=45954 RepID=A0A9D4HHE3_DREPO|nr:hypothetical protein DPMN_061702 [Dreissena polymorpha]